MRRVLDVTAAVLVGLVALSVVGVLAALVRWRMGAPVLFRQVRTGRHGKEFEILKLRTMRTATYAGEPDGERTGALGHWLRRYSLDELPQLWNVLRGDMAVIGPRPTLPEQVLHYDDRQRGRLSVRPGLTGWAQVNGRNSLSWPERIELDLYYVAHRSVVLDARILWLTVLRLLRPSGVTGAGGVNPGFPASSA